MYKYIYIYIYLSIYHLSIYHMSVYVCLQACMDVCIYVSMYACMCASRGHISCVYMLTWYFTVFCYFISYHIIMNRVKLFCKCRHVKTYMSSLFIIPVWVKWKCWRGRFDSDKPGDVDPSIENASLESKTRRYFQVDDLYGIAVAEIVYKPHSL